MQWVEVNIVIDIAVMNFEINKSQPGADTLCQPVWYMLF